MPRYLISYDSGADSVRGKLAGRLEKAGQRVQFSVFMVECSPDKYEKLVRELLSIVGDKDSLLCLPLCEQCYARATITSPPPPLMFFQ